MTRRLVVVAVLVGVFFVPVLGAEVQKGPANDGWGRLLQLIIDSAEETDRLQTELWVRGTADNPLPTPSDRAVYEINPVLAGRPGEKEPWFAFWRVYSENLAANPSSLARVIQVVWAGWQIKRVADNNVLARQTGLPQYWMLSYRWHF